jgi:preprotein translocase subunit Sec63
MMNGLIARYNVGRTQPDQLNQLSTSTLTPANIKNAYKRLAMHFHPDKSDENRSMFQELSNNYGILKRMFQIAGKKKKKMHKSR